MTEMVDEDQREFTKNCLYRFANVDSLSEVLGVPIQLATEEVIKKQSEELAARAKVVKSLENCDIYEYDEDEPEEEKEQAGTPMQTRRTQVKQEKETRSTSVDPSAAITSIVSPFDIDAFPDPLNWPKEATLRFLSLIAVNGIFGESSAEKIFYGFLSERMAVIKSDEPGLFNYCVVEEDREHIGKVLAVDLQPNYDIRPTPQECEEKLNQFYTMEYIKTKQMRKEEKPGGFEYKKSKQGIGSGGSLTRSRRTGRPNPLVEALVEEKKQHKRVSLT
ncbi:hypothetical protein FO519_007621 [Halicephalobus sp. NKZ332]|nr:hypothetical protein FO519_007621 [Halicephalobus sp. NKZ332]